MTSVVVLTANPAVDVTYRIDRQQIGETVRVREGARHPGGKGVNVARVLHQLGVPTTSVLPVGGTAGGWICRRLRAEGEDVRPVEIDGESRTTVTVVDGLSHPTTFVEPGPALSSADWRRLAATLQAALRDAGLLVIAGSLPRQSDPSVVADWIGLSNDAGVRTVVDVSGPALLVAAEAGATVVKTNRAELLAAAGRPSEWEAAAELRAQGCAAVVVTRAIEGIAAYTEDGMVEVPAIDGVEGNPVVAGDAATAGLVAALLDEVPVAGAVRHAAAAGAAAVLRPIASEIDLAAFRRFLDRGPREHR